MGNKNVIGGVLALMALTGLLGVTAVLMFLPVPEDNQQLINIVLMAIVGNVGTAFGFFLGASVAGVRKPDIPPAVAPDDAAKPAPAGG